MCVECAAIIGGTFLALFILLGWKVVKLDICAILYGAASVAAAFGVGVFAIW